MNIVRRYNEPWLIYVFDDFGLEICKAEGQPHVQRRQVHVEHPSNDWWTYAILILDPMTGKVLKGSNHYPNACQQVLDVLSTDRRFGLPEPTPVMSSFEGRVGRFHWNINLDLWVLVALVIWILWRFA